MNHLKKQLFFSVSSTLGLMLLATPSAPVMAAILNPKVITDSTTNLKVTWTGGDIEGGDSTLKLPTLNNWILGDGLIDYTGGGSPIKGNLTATHKGGKTVNLPFTFAYYSESGPTSGYDEVSASEPHGSATDFYKLIADYPVKDPRTLTVTLTGIHSETVPEPLTIIGSATALALGVVLRKKYSKANSLV
jgi:hypothetical protein